jgi:hypothetical protein
MEDSNYGEASQRTRAGIGQVRIAPVAIFSAELLQNGPFSSLDEIG